MALIHFTQFCLPDGRKKDVAVDRPDDIAEKADKIVEAGGRFEIEILTTGHISMTVETEENADDDNDGTVAHRICVNGPDVPSNVDQLVNQAYERLCVRTAS